MQNNLVHILLIAVFFLVQIVTAGGEEAAPQARIPLGQVVETMVSASDAAMSYALYVPSTYSSERKWPLLIAMDPRGRALIPMELYREAAEKLGYIIVSSYNTQSDAAWAPNVSAVKAILADIPQMFSIDDRRLYLTGFSGTAMGGWSFANNLSPHVAGLINFCGAVFEWSKPVKGAAYSFFGASGTKDFNYEEMRTLDKTLDSIGLSHRIVYFDGEHEWGPKQICSEGLEWMELQAMKSNLRPRDQKWIDELFAARMQRALGYESSGDLFEAYREYQSIGRDFSGVEPLEAASAKIKTLGDSKAVKDTMRTMNRFAEDQQEFVQKLFAYLNEAHFPTEPKAEIDRLNDLRIPSLLKQSSDSKNPLEALSAQRMLEIAFVHTSFYVPRKYLESNDSHRALKVLAVAEQIKPDNQRVLYMKAWAYVVSNDQEKAITLLSRMVELNFIPSADALAKDPKFAPLQKYPAFIKLLDTLRSS